MDTRQELDSALLSKLEVGSRTTNEEILSDREVERARVIVSDTEGVISCLDQKIAGLIAERDSLVERTSSVRIVLAPHKRIPTEILARVFDFAVAGEEIKFPPWRPQLCWVLRQICSRWRQIAINDSRIWNTITFDSSNVQEKRLSNMLSVIGAVISRTGPLSITLIHSNKDSFVTTTERLILPILHRLRDISLDIPASALATLFDLPPNFLASLQSICLGVSNASRPTTSFIKRPGTSLFFRGAVNLRRLELHCHSNKMNSALLSLPVQWNYLVSLSRTVERRVVAAGEA